MHTVISPELSSDPRAVAAEKVLRKCVHCGFCLATCPTYNLLGDELDSPRGRIYLIKQVVEGATPTRQTLTHLDRCLTCRNCETTCPSGVEYSHLLDNGRAMVEERVQRPVKQRLLRRAVLAVLPFQKRVTPLVKMGQFFRPILPRFVRSSVPSRQYCSAAPTGKHERTMLILDGCVQPAMTPATNSAVARILDSLSISTVSGAQAGCCGAISFHLNEQEQAKTMMRRNIDAWWPHIEAGAEAIITTASGCGVMVKDYKTALADDKQYCDKAARISDMCKDIAEVLSREDVSRLQFKAAAVGAVAFHPPCTLQHGQKLSGVTESLLRSLGFNLVAFNDSHTCCGSAGTYSLFQPALSKQLKLQKVESIVASKPDIVATSNIGCQLHLQSGTDTPVVHWVELIDRLLDESTRQP